MSIGRDNSYISLNLLATNTTIAVTSYWSLPMFQISLKLMGVYQGVTWWNPLWIGYSIYKIRLWTHAYVRATIVAFTYNGLFLYTILVAKGIYIYIYYIIINMWYHQWLLVSCHLLLISYIVCTIVFTKHKHDYPSSG